MLVLVSRLAIINYFDVYLFEVPRVELREFYNAISTAVATGALGSGTASLALRDGVVA